ncbi:hypothetical protein pdam_00013993 [Pocillopora damicornis]|uniref:Uncharacterized protein n=1 Tax=Pocillopora damicornis TaxID=46731 RepID=A0A3M6TI99_POCDA|nr:hypothetical protein pdam_00013993 [Pocillopora damicornis]
MAIVAIIIQIQVMTKRARLSVTKVLYLNPNNSARSLSTLITVVVNKDTPHKIVLDVAQILPVHDRRCIEWLHYKANTEVGSCQASKE